VLRFLAEDVGKELDAVLDAILRVLVRRRQSATKPNVSSSYGEAVNEIAYGLIPIGASVRNDGGRALMRRMSWREGPPWRSRLPHA
jgi:hypothetical protein